MATHRTRGTDRGFSFLEVLVAMAILAIAIIALADLFLLSIKKNAQSADQSRIAALAQDKMDELLSVPYLTMMGGTYPDSDAVRLEAGLSAQEYTRTWDVLVGTPEPNCMTITVTVDGADMGGKGHIGKRQRIQISMIKAGPLGGTITRN